jgi:hypothetical protein
MANDPLKSYLLQNPRSNNFYFRIRVPLALRRVVSKNEFRYSLRTSDELEARYLALKIAHKTKYLFKFILQHRSAMRDLTNEEIALLVYQEMRWEFNVLEGQRATWINAFEDEDLADYISTLRRSPSVPI